KGRSRAARTRRRRRKVTIWRLLQLIGAGCLVVVVLTHVAETFKLFPIMGWGLPTSPGHYLDLISAVLGCALLPLGFLGNVIAVWKISTGAPEFAAATPRNGMRIFPSRIFRLTRVTRIFQKGVFTKTTR